MLPTPLLPSAERQVPGGDGRVLQPREQLSGRQRELPDCRRPRRQGFNRGVHYPAVRRELNGQWPRPGEGTRLSVLLRRKPEREPHQICEPILVAQFSASQSRLTFLGFISFAGPAPGSRLLLLGDDFCDRENPSQVHERHCATTAAFTRASTPLRTPCEAASDVVSMQLSLLFLQFWSSNFGRAHACCVPGLWPKL